jgi:hypothetical protein
MITTTVKIVTLMAFLRARFDEDEAVTRTARQWSDRDWTYGMIGKRVFLGTCDGEPIAETFDDGEAGRSLAAHIAHWDPARVLADVTAKKAILDFVAPVVAFRTWADGDQQEDAPGSWDLMELWPGVAPVLLALTQPYAEHPDFDPAWRT